MNLTVQYTLPPAIGIACEHCDDVINLDDDYKYVKLMMGGAKISLHDACFERFLSALNQFDRVFIQQQQSERGRKIH